MDRILNQGPEERKTDKGAPRLQPELAGADGALAPTPSPSELVSEGALRLGGSTAWSSPVSTPRDGSPLPPAEVATTGVVCFSGLASEEAGAAGCSSAASFGGGDPPGWEGPGSLYSIEDNSVN
jgi:hypothetical protein